MFCAPSFILWRARNPMLSLGFKISWKWIKVAWKGYFGAWAHGSLPPSVSSPSRPSTSLCLALEKLLLSKLHGDAPLDCTPLPFGLLASTAIGDLLLIGDQGCKLGEKRKGREVCWTWHKGQWFHEELPIKCLLTDVSGRFGKCYLKLWWNPQPESGTQDQFRNMEAEALLFLSSSSWSQLKFSKRHAPRV